MSYVFHTGDVVHLPNKGLFDTELGPTRDGRVRLMPVASESGKYKQRGRRRWFKLSTVESQAIRYESIRPN